MGGMACEIDENVDAVARDQIGGGGIRHAGDVAPLPGRRPQPRGRGVGIDIITVAGDRDGDLGMRRQHAVEKISDRMVAEIGRDIADAQHTLRIRRIREHPRQPTLLKLPRGGPRLREKVGFAMARRVVQRHQKIVAGREKIRLERTGTLITCEGVIQPAGILQHIAKVIVGLRIIRQERDRAPVLRLGIGQLALRFERVTEIVMAFGVVGP